MIEWAAGLVIAEENRTGKIDVLVSNSVRKPECSKVAIKDPNGRAIDATEDKAHDVGPLWKASHRESRTLSENFETIHGSRTFAQFAQRSEGSQNGTMMMA